MDPRKLRDDFPILKLEINGHPLIYLDNAATTQKPIQVLNAIRDYYENCNANVHRAVNTLSHKATELYENTHEKVAKFINANSIEEIVFVRGTTEAINLIVYAWGLPNLSNGDEVLVSLMEHHSNLVPWEHLSKIKGFKVIYAGIHNDGTLDYKDLESKLSSRTKIVCLSHVSNVTGVINDIKRVTRLAHDNDALILVDGAQSVPHIPIDVKEIGIDFLAFSGHKMLAPTGIGVLFGKKEILDKMQPFQGGGEMIKQVTFNPVTRSCSVLMNDLPWKFEAGTPHISGGVGLMTAIEYLENIGMENVKDHEFNLTKYAIRRMKELNKVKIYGPKEIKNKCGIIPFNINGLGSHDVALFLDSRGIMTRSGFHCAQPLHERLKLKSSVRASFYIYNTFKEIDSFIEALLEVE